MLACGAPSTTGPDNAATPTLQPGAEMPVVQPIELPTLAPAQGVEPTPSTAGPAEGPGSPATSARSRLVIAPTLRPRLTVATLMPASVPDAAATPTPTETLVPTPTAVPTPTVTPVPTVTPTVAPTPTMAPAPIPTHQPQDTNVLVGQGAPSPIASQLAELGSALKWIAHFNNTSKNWSAYDPTGTFSQDQGQLPIPVNPPVGALTNLADGKIYWIGLSQNATFRGESLLAGLTSIYWRNTSTSVPTPVPTPAPAPTPTKQHESASLEHLEIAEQVAELESLLKWVAYWNTENNTWWLYDPTGTFPGVQALVPTKGAVTVGQLTRLEDGQYYLLAITRDVKFRQWFLVAMGSGVNQLKWVDP